MNTEVLSNFIIKLKKLENGENTIAEKIVDNIADNGVAILWNKYANIDYDISGNEKPILYIDKLGANHCEIVAMGRQVAYIEFGTGNKGKATVSAELEAKKSIVGASDYNSGKTIQDKVPIFIGTTISDRAKYRYVRGWYKPDYALTEEERIRYDIITNNIIDEFKSKKRNKEGFSKRAFKYTHGTEGIIAGQQIYDTARELEIQASEIAKQIIKEELK